MACTRTNLTWKVIFQFTLRSFLIVDFVDAVWTIQGSYPARGDVFLYRPHLSLSDSESSDEDLGQANNNMDCDPTFAGACSSNEPHLLTQGDLNDNVRDLNLSKKQAELLGSGLKGSSAPAH